MIRKRIIKNTFINSGGKFLCFLLQLFIVAYLIKSLGKEAYGIVVLALALVANIELLEAGFGVAVTKYVAEYRTRREWDRLLEIVNTNLIVNTALAACFSGVLVLINEIFLERIFTVPVELLTSIKNLVRFLILASVVGFWSVSIIRVAEGFQRYLFVRIIELLKWLSRAVFIILAIENGYGLVGVGIAYLGASVINLMMLYLFIFVREPKLKLNPFLSTRKSFKLLFGFSIWIFLSKVFAFLSYRIDVILIGIFLSPVFLTYYDVAFKIYQILKFGFSLIPSTLVPVTSELSAVADLKRLRLLFKKASSYTVMLMWPVLVFSLFYAAKIINLWVGDGFNTSVLLAQLFVISLFPLAFVLSGAEMMVGLNRVKELAICAGIASAINLILSIILIMKIGVYGVVVGTLIGACVLSGGRLYLMLPRFNLSFWEFQRGILTKSIIGSIVLGGVFFIFPENLFTGIIGIALYFIFMITFMVDRDDKKEFLRIFNLKERMVSNFEMPSPPG